MCIFKKCIFGTLSCLSFEELFNSFSKISDRLIKIPTILAIVVTGSKAYGS